MATTFPTDKNTYAISDKIIRQTECQYKFGRNTGEFSLRFMGDVAEATQLAASFRQDSRVALTALTADFKELSVINTSDFETHGKVVSSIAQTKKGSGTANVVISVPYDGKLKPSADEAPDEYKIVTWAERSTKWQFGLEVYAGDVSADSNLYACAGDYQAWVEQDKQSSTYKKFQYPLTVTEGEQSHTEIVGLSARTLDLAKKRYAGIENVERGYPEVIRTTQYYYIEADDEEVDRSVIDEIDEEPKLYEIDNSISSVWKSKFDGYSWLKAGYDVETSQTEYEGYWNATVTESWIGINEAERGPWDKNLYGVVTGQDRWPFYTKDLSA